MTSFIKLMLLLYILIGLLFYLFQEWLIFPKRYVPKQMQHHKDFTAISFDTDDKTTLHGMHKILHPNAPTILYFGGNGENVLAMSEIFAQFQEYNWLTFNYRGYGKSEGKPSQKAILNDALALYDHFSQEYNIRIALGRSLGTSVATYLTSSREIDKLILITPFDSLANVAKTHYPILQLFPLDILLQHNFDTQKYMQTITTKVYMLVGKYDKVIPKPHSNKLKKSIQRLEHYQEVEGGHNTIIGTKSYTAFIQKALKD